MSVAELEEIEAQQPAENEVDEALLSYLQAADEAAAELVLSRLLYEQAEPVIGSILRHKLRVTLRDANPDDDNQEALALRSSLRMQLLSELETQRAQPGSRALKNFRSHVAELTYQACEEHTRLHRPKRHSLKNKLRYLLTHNPEFALWEVERRELIGGTRRELMAGLAVWRDLPETRNEDLWSALREEPAEWAALNWPGHNPQSLHPAELLQGLFNGTQGPVELDDLVAVCSAIWRLPQGVTQSSGKAHTEDSPPMPGEILAAALKLEQIECLRLLWAEVGQLPARQRVALLLNLRDANGRSVIALLPLAGIAAIRQIAGILEMPPEDLAGLWAQLPLDDAIIAERLGLTRQQVINLRRVGRERLARNVQWIDV